MLENIMEKELHEILSSNYIDYAYETIQERAIVDIRDGLKPVHLRILYDMNNLGLTHNSKTVKSARVVGDVLGKYHPHGDSSVYQATVGLSQDWNMRYPLVHIRGNNGGLDGDPAAASRYTECKLSKYGEEMIKNIDKDTVDFVPNFDNTLQEPTILPSLLPNYLANGTNGIACGFAPNIPSHNLTEIYDACIFLLDDIISGKLNEIEEDKIINYLVSNIKKRIKGPDLPCGGVIIDNKEWSNIIKTGKGKVIVKAKYEIVENKKKEKQMIITELPYQVNKLALVEKIEDMIDNNQIDGIKNIIDSSRGNEVKIVITFKKSANHEIAINNLLSKTDLKKNINYIMYGLKNKELKGMNIIDAIDEFLEHGLIVTQREAKYDYDKKNNRALLLDAMIKILESDETLSEAIEIIRYHKENKLADLMERFDLNEEQANYILSRQLNSLSEEQQEKYINESNILNEEIPVLKSIMDNENNAAFKKLRNKLEELKDKYGDERRTAIEIESEITDEDLIKDEDLIITITSEGNIKSVLASEYNTQRRNGKGSKGVNVKDNEIVTQLFTLNSKDDLLFITNIGKVHHIKAYKIPKVAKTAKGRNIANYMSLEENEYLVKTIATKIDYDNEDNYLMLVTDKGQIKKMALNLLSKRRNVTKVLTLKDNHKIVDAELVNESDDILLATAKGNCARYNSSVIRAQGKTSQGVIGIRMKEDTDKVVCLTKVAPDKELLSVTELGLAKKTHESEFTCAKTKGGKGIRGHKLSDKTGDLVTIIPVIDDELLVATSKGKIIRLDIVSLQSSKRDTTGSRLIKLEKDDLLKTVSLAPKNKYEAEDEA